MFLEKLSWLPKWKDWLKIMANSWITILIMTKIHCNHNFSQLPEQMEIKERNNKTVISCKMFDRINFWTAAPFIEIEWRTINAIAF